MNIEESVWNVIVTSEQTNIQKAGDMVISQILDGFSFHSQWNGESSFLP